jgi:DNA-binding transcriptional regulator YiaG
MTADELRTARWRMQLTQRALAERLGVSRRILQHWETGQRPVPPFIALAMSALFPPPMENAHRPHDAARSRH